MTTMNSEYFELHFASIYKITQQLIWYPYSVESDEKTPMAKDLSHWCQSLWCAKRNI